MVTKLKLGRLGAIELLGEARTEFKKRRRNEASQ